MEERLDPHYFNTTPKNSCELLKWGFSEPSKLNAFSKKLSKKRSILWFLKIYGLVVVISTLLYVMIKSIFVYFDIPLKYSSYFKDEFIQEWHSLTTFYNKFFFDIKSIYIVALLKVDYLSREESLELITNPVDDFNLVYADEVAHAVYELTCGHPQLLQTICSIIVTIANSENQKEVTKEKVAKAKEQVFEINEMPMTIFWREFCGDEEREVMEQILENREIIKETKEQKRAVARLVDYGFIGADMTIRVPLFEKWLRGRRDLVEI